MIQVRIREHIVGESLDIFLIRAHDGERYVLHMEDSRTFRWDSIGTAIAAPDGVYEPSFTLPFDTGRALLEALTRHYNGAEDTRALRRDYDAERKRVDTAVEVIADIARSLAIRSAH